MIFLIILKLKMNCFNFKDIAHFKEDKEELEKKLQKSKKEKQNIDGQMRELQDQLEAEQYFSVFSIPFNYDEINFLAFLSNTNFCVSNKSVLSIENKVLFTFSFRRCKNDVVFSFFLAFFDSKKMF